MHRARKKIHACGKPRVYNSASDALCFLHCGARNENDDFIGHADFPFRKWRWLLFLARRRSPMVALCTSRYNTSPEETFPLEHTRAAVKFGTSGWRAIVADEFTFANVRLAVAAIAEHVRSRNPNP